MKRVLSMLLAVCLCCGLLAGCGKRDGGEKEKKAVTEKKEYVILGKKAKTIEGVCSYRVPEKWEETETDWGNGYEYTYSFEDGYLKVWYVDVYDVEENRKQLKDLILASYAYRAGEFKEYDEIEGSEVVISGQSQLLGEYSCKNEDGLEGTFKIISAEYNKGYMGVELMIYDSAEYLYNKAFKEIIDCVQIDMDTPEELTGNILLDSESEIKDLLSETGEFVGRRILYKLSKRGVQAVSQEQFVEFMNDRVLQLNNEVFNYVTIDFGDGTGLLFMPGVAAATYGEIDETGSIINQIGVAMLEESGVYSYSQTN